MYFLVDIPTCNRLGLQGAEALVFSCLAFLCRDKGYWQGSYSKLAEYSLCGSHDTANRACSSLVEKGLLTHTGTKFVVITQNASCDTQNASCDTQNASYTEKESTKEKEKIIKKREGNNKPSPDFLEKGCFSSSPVDKITAAQFGAENGIPIEVVGKWWYHCDEREWRHNDGTRIVNWQSSLQKWFLREKQMNMLFITNGCPLPSGEGTGVRLRNEEIRKAELQRQHEEREKAEREGVSIPESLAAKFAKFAQKK